MDRNQDIESFYRKFFGNKSRSRRRSLMIDESTDPMNLAQYNVRNTDVAIRIAGSDRSWAVHETIVAKYSNFFGRGLAGGFSESLKKEINLHEVNETIVDFVITYMYEGWVQAATKTFDIWMADLLPINTIAQILVLADYLDMPVLCYEAYKKIESGLARLVATARWDVQFSHSLCVRGKPFLEAVEVLENGSIIGADISAKITDLLTGLKGVNTLQDAARVFESIFGDSTTLDWELQW
ncbi:hypothetical protein F4677DRAFT_458258 [Hypoxylon crocopeplum]|nr:hypothetical protein F4677DRAFT_458258 [Hypoxylon crocopeplum]